MLKNQVCDIIINVKSSSDWFSTLLMRSPLKMTPPPNPPIGAGQEEPNLRELQSKALGSYLRPPEHVPPEPRSSTKVLELRSPGGPA